jgi:hypothetical protein
MPYIVFGSDTLFNKGAEDIFLAEYSAIGNLLWAENVGWRGTINASNALATDMNGNIYVTGNLQDTLAFGPDTLIDKYNSVFLAKSSDPTYTGQKELKTVATQNVIVYPNPTTNNITVQMNLDKEQNVEFILYNIMGEMVYDSKVSEQEGTILQEIDLSLLPDGIYLVKVNEGDKYFTNKIVKQ